MDKNIGMCTMALKRLSRYILRVIFDSKKMARGLQREGIKVVKHIRRNLESVQC